MRAIRLTFAWLFAAAAALMLWQARVFFQAGINAPEPSHPSVTVLKTALVGGSLLLAALFVLSGFAVLKHLPSANKLALGASVTGIVYGILVLFFEPVRLLHPAWIPIGFGIAGLAVFSRRAPAAPAAAKRLPYKRIAGDGTNPVVNRLILVAGIAGGIGGVRMLALWAIQHGLPRSFPSMFVAQMLMAILMVLAIHEAGHALAGAAVCMKLTGFVVGPFYCLKLYGRWNFTFRSAGLLAFSGYTMVAPATMKGFLARKAVQVAAGPAASLIAGFAGTELILHSAGRPWAGEWGILAVFVTINSLVGMLNLIPFGNKSMYSDGAKLYQLLSGGTWAAYHRALGMVSATTVTPLRPRDFEIATLERAAATIAQGNDELFLHLCAYSFYLDSGRIGEAAAAIEKAEACCRQWSLSPSAESAAMLVTGNALLRHDAQSARRWWEHMGSRKSYRFSDVLLDVRCALLYSENRMEEAEADWRAADAWASRLPATGQGAAKRDFVKLLRATLDERLAERRAGAQERVVR